MWIPGTLFALLFVISVIRDPRRVRCGVFLLAAILSLFLMVFSLFTIDASTNTMAYVLLSMISLAILVVILLGMVLILNGFTMIRKEGRRLGNLLGFFLGLLMVVYVVVAVISVMRDDSRMLIWVAMAGTPLTFLGFGFVSCLFYSWCYLFVTRKWKKIPDAVVVLGSGLVDNRVTPLLASRLDAGLSILERAPSDQQPVFVVSGGMGTDERRSEASAMAEYVASKDIDVRIIQEDTSRTTKENIANTKVLLDEAGFSGQVAVVTNNFHAFRAARLLRAAGIRGWAVGSPTARYFWPTATIREYAAILADSLPFVIVCLCLCCVPLIIGVVTALF